MRDMEYIGVMGQGDRRTVWKPSGDVVHRAESGDQLMDARFGRPMAELSPSAVQGDASTLLERWCRLPYVDPERLHSDIDDVMDPTL